MDFTTWNRRFWVFLEHYIGRYPVLKKIHFALTALTIAVTLAWVRGGQMATDTLEHHILAQQSSYSLSTQISWLLFTLVLSGLALSLFLGLLVYLTQISSLELGKTPRPPVDWLGEASCAIIGGFAIQFLLNITLFFPPLYLALSTTWWLIVGQAVWSLAVESTGLEEAFGLAWIRLFSRNSGWLLLLIGGYALFGFVSGVVMTAASLTDLILIPGSWLSLCTGGILSVMLSFFGLLTIYGINYTLIMNSDHIRTGKEHHA